MALNPTYTLSFSLVDRSGEIGRFGINTLVPAESNELTNNALITAFRSALVDITAGTLKSVQFSEVRRVSNAESGEGQREDKVLVVYEDTVTLTKYAVEIPTVDMITPAGDDQYDLTAPPWPAFVAAFEALAVSPDGNALNVLSATRVGRNI